MWEDLAPPSQHQNLSKSLPGSLDQMVKNRVALQGQIEFWQLEPRGMEVDQSFSFLGRGQCFLLEECGDGA